MRRAKFKPFDAASYLKSEDDIASYMEAAAEECDPHLFAEALEDVKRARQSLGSPHKQALRRKRRQI
ncbi:DNA-binding protein [Hyphomicrobium sp.]|jgi:DNA-binding phage protein|uniref:helix-turn-helix domain-containing transcriptional regulator n=1 Tax=Hyphomicrobium sp. TaxID=82 RepID=UPI0035686452